MQDKLQKKRKSADIRMKMTNEWKLRQAFPSYHENKIGTEQTVYKCLCLLCYFHKNTLLLLHKSRLMNQNLTFDQLKSCYEFLILNYIKCYYMCCSPCYRELKNDRLEKIHQNVLKWGCTQVSHWSIHIFQSRSDKNIGALTFHSS
jgi:hypothetical protein